MNFRNRGRCKKCGDVIESKHERDYVTCTCKAIFLDGGKQFWRGGGPADAFERINLPDSQEVA